MPLITSEPVVEEEPTPRDDRLAVVYSEIVFLLITMAFWTFPVIRKLIAPLKLFTIGWHELCHLGAALVTGGSILSICIDPNLGGACEIEGGHPPTILAAGYLGSIIFGSALLLGGWNLLMAKILSFFIAFGLVMPLILVRDKITIILIAIYEILLIGFWFIDHGSPLRWYCLFLGVMNILYILWDIADERFMKKKNTSDITQYVLLYPSTWPPLWTTLWVFLASAALAGFSVMGYKVFNLDSDQMYAQAARWLPT